MIDDLVLSTDTFDNGRCILELRIEFNTYTCVMITPSETYTFFTIKDLDFAKQIHERIVAMYRDLDPSKN